MLIRVFACATVAALAVATAGALYGNWWTLALSLGGFIAGCFYLARHV